MQIKICTSYSIGVKCKLWKGGHYGLNGEDNAASSMKRTTQRPRRRGGRLRPGRRAVAMPDARRPRQCIQAYSKLASRPRQMGNRQRWQLGKPTTVPRGLSSSILDGRKKGRELPINTCAQRFLLGSPRTSGLGAPRAGRNLGRDGGSIGRTEILGRFLGYYWNTKFLLYVQKLILGVSFGHSWRYSRWDVGE